MSLTLLCGDCGGPLTCAACESAKNARPAPAPLVATTKAPTPSPTVHAAAGFQPSDYAPAYTKVLSILRFGGPPVLLDGRNIAEQAARCGVTEHQYESMRSWMCAEYRNWARARVQEVSDAIGGDNH